MDQIRVGFARVDITPEEYTTLSGLGNDSQRMANHILDRLTGTCVAIRDNKGETVLIVTVDMLLVTKWSSDELRAAMHAATGVPAEHILVSATHTHSAPSLTDQGDGRIQRFYERLFRQMARAAVEAIEDLKPATVYVGQRRLEHMTFVRRYLLRSDGSFVNRGWGLDPNTLMHMDSADDQLQVIRFQREGGRDVVLVNWQSHSTMTSGTKAYNISADYPGVMRSHVEGSAGCHCAFFQGASGNLVPNSMIPEEQICPHDHIQYGRMLAEDVLKCLDENMRPVAGGAVKISTQDYVGEIDHSDDSLFEKATQLREKYWSLDEDARKAALDAYGFNSVYHANYICWRAGLGETENMEMTAVSAGGVSFVAVPFEMFNSNGRYIKDNTPFDMTFVLALCNGYHSYLADDNAFNYDCYEVNTRRFKRGTAEAVAKSYLDMLNQMQA